LTLYLTTTLSRSMFNYPWKQWFTRSYSAPADGLTSQSTQQLPSQQLLSPEPNLHSPQQQQQPRPVSPWSEHRLNLPTTFLSENAPPSRPSSSPFPRHGHVISSTANDAGELFIFGGVVHRDNSPRNDLHVYSTRDHSTSLLQTSGVVPCPRFRPAGARFGTFFFNLGRGHERWGSGRVK
jgi:hypothetical protein